MFSSINEPEETQVPQFQLSQNCAFTTRNCCNKPYYLPEWMFSAHFSFTNHVDSPCSCSRISRSCYHTQKSGTAVAIIHIVNRTATLPVHTVSVSLIPEHGCFCRTPSRDEQFQKGSIQAYFCNPCFQWQCLKVTGTCLLLLYSMNFFFLFVLIVSAYPMLTVKHVPVTHSGKKADCEASLEQANMPGMASVADQTPGTNSDKFIFRFW